MEDAAALLQDFVGSIDNLPHEVAFLLSEIAHKEIRIEDIRSKIASRDSSIQKNQKANGLMQEGPKEASQILKCRVDFAKAQTIADEKVMLADRGVRLLTRHMNRLNTELNKLQGVQPYTMSANFGVQVLEPVVPLPAALSPLPMMNAPVQAETSSRKRKNLPAIDTAAAAAHRGQSPTPHAYASAQQSAYNYKESATSASGSRAHRPSRLSSTFAAVSPSAYNRAISPAANASNKKQRLSATQSSGRQRLPAQHDEMDAEGEDDDAEGEEIGSSDLGVENQNDDTPYCICQKPSYGEMVGCDNAACRYEWFHMPCVGLSKPPAGQWYCPMCEEGFTKRSGTPLSANTGRRKR